MGMPFGESLALSVIGFAIFGLLAMIGMPRQWQNLQGWLLVSFVGIPGFLAVIALLVNAPGLIVGVAFVLGILAMQK